jgi:hypothetical protein
VAVRHCQAPLDFVIEDDALDGTLGHYKVLYLTDKHVSRPASEAIAQWVKDGGRLFATAGAGMFDELNRPNTVMRDLMGIELEAIEAPDDKQVGFIKQDLPFSEPLDAVTAGDVKMPAIGVRCRLKLKDARAVGTFADGSPAVALRRVGNGYATCCAFLPGLSYFKPAIPLRPVDRGSTDQAMAHFIPTQFDAGARALIEEPLADLVPPVVCSEPLVESTVIEAKGGTLIPLVNWSAGPVKGLKVTATIPLPAKSAELAGGGALAVAREDGRTVFTLDLDVADAIILR